MKKRRDYEGRKRQMNRIRKVKEGRRLAMSMVSRVAGIDRRIDTIDRTQKAILETLRMTTETMQDAGIRLVRIENTWYRRLWRRIFGRR